MIKINFYTKLNGTIIKCTKVTLISEILIQNFEDFKKRWEGKDLPMEIVVEEKLMDKINHEVARLASSHYHSKRYKIYFDVNKKHVIEIKSL